MSYPSLKITYNDRGCPIRVTYQGQDYNGHDPEPISGGAPDLATALRNLAGVVEDNGVTGRLAMMLEADSV